MMAKFWCLVLFAMLVELQDALAANNVQLQKVFEQLLDVPSVEPKNHGQAPIPQYMMELYERLRNGHIGSWSGSNKSSDIVRSISPMKENVGRQHLLVYNLHRVTDEEQVFHAELHFFRKKSHKWSTLQKIKTDPEESKTSHNSNKNMTDFRLRIVDMSKSQLRLLGTIPLADRGRGWKIQDISSMFLQCRASKGHKGQHLLGVQFQAFSRKSSKYRSVPPSRVVNLDTQPFVVVFSNRTNPVKSINLLEMQTQLTAGYQDMEDKNAYPEDKDHLFEDKSEQDTVFNTKRKNHLGPGNVLKRVPRSIADNHVPEGSRGWTNDQRVSRSIYDNELPDNTVHATIIHQTSPGVLRSRSESRQRATDPSIIPYPSSSSSRANGSRRGHRRKNGGKKPYNDKQREHRRLPKLWQRVTTAPRHINDATTDLEQISHQDDSVCRRRKLVVDFADIGWGEWIISPKSFEAHYCAGACPFPLTKELRPSNHATIQSIVNAIGLQPHVPPPCCVADSMSSVTLLYFDEDRNVVLKNYPGMTVESCACR